MASYSGTSQLPIARHATQESVLEGNRPQCYHLKLLFFWIMALGAYSSQALWMLHDLS